MAGGGVSKNIWNCFRTAPAGTGQPLTCSTSGMGVFDMAQSVVAQAAGIIGSDASIDISSVMTDLEPRLMEMDLGPLFGLWFQSLFIGITMWALYICIFIVIYGRMIEIYLVTSVAPVPMAAMMGKEWGGMGQNYLRSLLALGFQAFLIIGVSFHAQHSISFCHGSYRTGW
jgi:hypothetical protein